MRFDARTRAKALEAGFWQQSDNSIIHLRDMDDHHLMNALLKATEDSEPDGITHPLAAEVTRRGLTSRLLAIADGRELWRRTA